MNISELKHRIQIEYEIYELDEYGGYTSTWHLYNEVWANAIAYKICYSAINSYDSTQNYTFVIRKLAELDPSMRVIFNNQTYKIIRIKKLDEQGEFYEIYTNLRN